VLVDHLLEDGEMMKNVHLSRQSVEDKA
jgi:hypothetical protein